MEEQDLEELKQNSVYEYIEQFDAEFGSMLKDKIKDAPLLVNIFREYIEQNYKMSKYYQMMLHKIVEIEDDFCKSFTSKQKQLFKKWETYRNGMEDDAVLEAFIYGYCLNQELDLEKNKYKQS